MKKMTSNEIRNTWLRFWKSKGHMIEPGASLVPNNDPTLLWINAGVAALKKYFDGSEKPTTNRISNIQKCLRTNDIENVGMTARHQTFFEMLGNFSIGDYFRTEAITWAYELLTSEEYFGIPVTKLYFTFHPSDTVTKNLWISLGVPEDHMVPCEGNFWEIGAGPCGPDTEIFFDRGEKYDPENIGPRLIEDDIENDRYIEIWNIVFSQYNSKPGLKREEYPELPQKNIDTGGGLERFCCVLQGVDTNFETDLFVPIIKATETLATVKYSPEIKFAYHVIADHIRTCVFALSDGAMFSNEGRGYVLRRILRRAVRFGKKIGINGAFLYKLVPVVVEIMKDFYPYIEGRMDQVAKFIKIEEEKFDKTLVAGENMLVSILDSGVKVLPAKDAFTLYDTYGFPLELTVEMCKERGVSVDEEGFKEEMQKQKERARQARVKKNSMHLQSADLLDFTKESEFVYEVEDVEATIIGLFKDGVKVDSIEDNGEIILSKTNFYAESGGQVADTGIIETEQGNIIVENVIKSPNKQNLHTVDTQGITIKEGDKVITHINVLRRKLIQRNHSAIHILQKVLQQVLGSHIAQAGSYCDDEKFRFDFSHFEKITPAQLKEIELKVNEKVAEALPADIKNMPIEEAKKLGAMALFSEKYGNVVRVVNFGGFSIEFCGGCHVANTQEIGMVAIKFEESISSGVRRIEGVTSIGAYKYMKERDEILEKTNSMVSTSNVYDFENRLKATLEDLQSTKEELQRIKDKLASAKASEILNKMDTSKEVPTLIAVLDKAEKDLPIKIVDLVKEKHPSYFIYLVNNSGDRLALLCACSKDLISKGINCGNIIKETAKIVQGGGGGSPFLAQAGGKDVTKVNELIFKVKEIIK